ncbi:M48 family metallopeptidase [Iningainema tapete]|uniref:M48 family metallopeptidase n=1 Tax=Iningainema tapete BLCC-T55 TaxID=2748662 RepID=A0A8J7BW22_9CYAN|nr:SprT family zinc-dependent metalloprotease [Iningainema tapete]MBD2770987.1 M48 family metallopeptidase [Iningainema tapete BLCC-T55]
MPILQIGQTSIPYTVRYSRRTKHQRIVVTPEAVEVVAPADTPKEQIAAFVDTKRRWLFNAIEDCRSTFIAKSPQRYVSGAKLVYRGRQLMVQLEDADVEEVTITCIRSFHIQVPRHLKERDRHTAIDAAFVSWQRNRVLQDTKRFAKSYARKLNIETPTVRLSEQKHTWGTCGLDGIIRINWQLVQAPLAAMEYVVAHEVVHLLHRHHGDAFWETLGSVMPDWRERKALLESWEFTP